MLAVYHTESQSQVNIYEEQSVHVGVCLCCFNHTLSPAGAVAEKHSSTWENHPPPVHGAAECIGVAGVTLVEVSVDVLSDSLRTSLEITLREKGLENGGIFLGD